MELNDNSLPERINKFVEKQQIQKGPKGAIAGGILGGLATGHPLGILGGAYVGHKLIGFGSRNKKKKKGILKPSKNRASNITYRPGSAKRV